MGRQAAPAELHLVQAKWNDVGLPVHVPRVATSVSPTSAVPEMVGRVLGLGFALAAAFPAPGCPMTAPSTTPAATARTSPSRVRIRWPRSIARSLVVDLGGVVPDRAPAGTPRRTEIARSFQRAFREATRSPHAAPDRSAAAPRRASRRRRRAPPRP